MKKSFLAIASMIAFVQISVCLFCEGQPEYSRFSVTSPSVVVSGSSTNLVWAWTNIVDVALWSRVSWFDITATAVTNTQTNVYSAVIISADLSVTNTIGTYTNIGPGSLSTVFITSADAYGTMAYGDVFKISATDTSHTFRASGMIRKEQREWSR